MLLAPAVLVYALFALYPMISVIIHSFMKLNGLSATADWVGLTNYIQLFNSSVFWTALWNTVIWTALSLIFPPLVGLALAVALNQNITSRALLRAIFYLPVIIAPIAIAVMWGWMYNPFFGLFTQLLGALGLQHLTTNWLGDPDIALYSVFVAYLWHITGISLVLFLAGLQNVSQTLVEAARIDGATRTRIFRHVTLPALRPIISIVVVLAFINSLKGFAIIYGMTGGGPAKSTQILPLWAYIQSIQLGNLGNGSAITVIMLIVTLTFVLPYLWWSFKREEATR